MMKRLVYRLIVGLIAFTTGLSLSSIWKQSHGNLELASQDSLSSVRIPDLEPAVTICEVNAHPELYLGKRIRLRSWFYKSNEHGGAEEVSMCPGVSSTISVKLIKMEPFNLFSLPQHKDPSDLYTAVKYLNVEVVGYLDRNNIADLYYMSDARIIRVFSTKIMVVPKFVE